MSDSLMYTELEKKILLEQIREFMGDKELEKQMLAYARKEKLITRSKDKEKSLLSCKDNFLLDNYYAFCNAKLLKKN
jgi:hypothetical protein